MRQLFRLFEALVHLKAKNIPVNKLKQHATKNSSYTTLPATNSHIAPETACLEDYFPFGTALFPG